MSRTEFLTLVSVWNFVPHGRRHAQSEGGRMNIEQERKDFEAWFKESDHYLSFLDFCLTPDGRYEDDDVEVAWEAWQARASLQSQHDEETKRLRDALKLAKDRARGFMNDSGADTDSLPEIDAALEYVDSWLSVFAQKQADSRGEAAQSQPSGNTEQLNDAVRVPLDSLHADADYLIGRVMDASLTRDEVVAVIRSRIDEARSALAQNQGD